MTHADSELSTTKSQSQAGTDTADGTEMPQSGTKADATEAAGEIRQEVQRLKDEIKQRSESLLKGQRNAAAAEVGSIAQDLHRTAQELSERDQLTTARYVDRAAEVLDRMVDTLREGELRAVLRKTEDFARRNPGVFFGGSILVGLILSRFLKSSAERRETEAAYGSAGHTGTESRYTH